MEIAKLTEQLEESREIIKSLELENARLKHELSQITM